MTAPATALTVFQNRPLKTTLVVQGTNGVPFALENTYEGRFYRTNNTTPFATTSDAGAALSLTMTGTVTDTITIQMPATAMAGLEGYGSLEMLDLLTGRPLFVVPVRFVKEGTPYTPTSETPLTLFNEAVVVVVSTVVSQWDKADGTVQGSLTVSGNATIGGTLTVNGGTQQIITQQVVQTVGGNDALEVVPASLRSRKFLALALASGGAAQGDGAGWFTLSALEALPGISIGNATGGLVTSRKKRTSVIAANKLRLHHSVSDGAAQGALFETAFSYLNGYSQALASQTAVKSNIVDAATPAGETGAWLRVAVAGTTAYAHRVVQVTAGVDYHITAEVIMDDGAAPVVGTASNAGDLSLAIQASVVLRNPVTGAVGPLVQGPFAGGKYLISGYFTATATATAYFGWTKYASQSGRQFSIGRVNAGQGRWPPSQFDNATASPNARVADVCSVPVSGFTTDALSLLVKFTMPFTMFTPQYLVNVTAATANDRLAVLIAADGTLQALVVAGGVSRTLTLAAAGALAYGSTVKCGLVVDWAAKARRGKATGIAAVAAADQTGLPAAPLAVEIGNFGGAYQPGTAIAEVALVDRALSATELAAWTG